METGLSKREFALAATITCVIVGAFAGVFAWVMHEEEQYRPRNMKRHLLDEAEVMGNQIITRLEAYRNEIGSYPKNLEELAKWDGIAIPNCPAGIEEWGYLNWSLDDRFMLRVCLVPSCYPVLYWDSQEGEWYLDQ